MPNFNWYRGISNKKKIKQALTIKDRWRPGQVLLPPLIQHLYAFVCVRVYMIQ